jgi:hypothetical protein
MKQDYIKPFQKQSIIALFKKTQMNLNEIEIILKTTAISRYLIFQIILLESS